MSIRKFRAGRVSNASASTWVGERGTIFYDEVTGQLKIADGTTPGGRFIELVNASSTVAGAVKLGPGVVLNPQGQIIIDSTGLSFNFGNLYAFTNPGPNDGACISSTGTNQDVNIVSNGMGSVNVIGEFNVHTTNANLDVALSTRPAMSVTNAGYTTINVPTISTGNTGLLVNGNSSDPFPPTVGGVTLRTVGNDGMTNTVAFDSHGTGVFPSITLRGTRGTGNAPTAIKLGDVLGRIAGVGFGTTTFSVDGTGRAATDIRFIATEDFTDTVSGTKIEFYTSPNGGTVKTLSATILSTGITTSNVIVGTTTYGNNAIYSSATTTDLVIGQTGATANLVVNRTTSHTKDVYVAGNVFVTGQAVAQNFRGASRDAGTLGAGGTLTINYATDHHVLVNITGAITIAHTNIAAGRNVKVVIINATGTNYAVNTGVPDLNATGNNAGANLNSSRMGFYEFISFGTTTANVYVSINK